MGKAFKTEKFKPAEPGHDGFVPVLVAPKGAAKWEKADELTEENVNVNRIRFLFHKGSITHAQYEAACALQRDWETAEILPQASSILVGNGASGGGATLPGDHKIQAMRRKGDAMAAVPEMCRRIVELVVIENVSVGKASAIVRAHHQFTMALLLVGLNAISRTYGFSS